MFGTERARSEEPNERAISVKDYVTYDKRQVCAALEEDELKNDEERERRKHDIATQRRQQQRT